MRAAIARRPLDDPTVLLGITGRGAWLLYGLFALTTIVLGINGGPPMQTAWGVIAVIATLVAGAIGVSPAPYPLPLSRTVAIVVLGSYVNVAITWQLTPNVWPGWASWNFGMTALVYIALAMRGRILWSWIGLIAMVASSVVWSAVAGGNPLMGFQLCYLHLAINVAVSLFAIGIRRSVLAIGAFRSVERSRAHELAARHAADAEWAQETAALGAQARPLLQAIADDEVSAEGRIEIRLLEARLRDRLRARRLDDARLTAAVDAARRRGAEVVVLDDVDTRLTVGDELRDAMRWATDLVERGRADQLTVRLFSRQGDILLSVSSDDEREPSLYRLGGTAG